MIMSGYVSSSFAGVVFGDGHILSLDQRVLRSSRVLFIFHPSIVRAWSPTRVFRRIWKDYWLMAGQTSHPQNVLPLTPVRSLCVSPCVTRHRGPNEFFLLCLLYQMIPPPLFFLDVWHLWNAHSPQNEWLISLLMTSYSCWHWRFSPLKWWRTPFAYFLSPFNWDHDNW